MARQVGDRITFKQAHPKPAPKPKPFAGFKPVSAPSFGQKKAQRKVNRAAARLPQSKTPLPAVPKLAHPTHAQRQEALKLTSKAIQPKRLPGETAQHALTRLSQTGTKQIKGQTKQTTKNVRALVTPRQRLALQRIAVGPTAKEGPKPTKVSIAGVNILPGLKAAEHKLGQGLMPAGQVLRFATLPANVIAGAAQGKSPSQSINEQPSFYDLLKKVTPKKFQHSGVQKAALAGAGTVLDTATDPTTYLTLGTGVPEEVAAKAAARAAEEKGAASLADKGISVGARVHVPFTSKTLEKASSGKASRKALQTLSTPGTKAAGKAVKSELRHVAPDLTPTFRTPTEHRVIREAERRYRSAIREGEGKIGRHVTALGKALKDQNPENVVNAIERAPQHLSQYRSYEEAAKKHEALTRLERGAMKGRVKLEQIAKERPLTDAEQKALGRARRRANTFGDQTTAASKVLGIQRGNLNANRFDLSSLNPQEQAVAHKVVEDFHNELQQKSSRDLGAGTFKPTGPEDAQRYFPHVNPKKFEQGTKTARRAFPTLKAAAEKGRGIRKPIAVTNAETPGLFETNVPRAVGQKLAETNKAAATHDLWQSVASTGKPVTNDTLGHLTEEDLKHTRIYEVTPRGLTTVEDAHGGFDKKAAVDIASGKRKGHFALLDSRSVHDVERRLASSGVAETGIGRFLDRTTGRLKYAATMLNPSFMPRNALGDSINAFMGEARAKGFGEAANLMRVEHARNAFESSADAILNPTTPDRLQHLLGRQLHFPSGTQTYGDLLDEMRHEGAIDTGQFGAELRNMLGQEGSGSIGKTYRVRAVNEYRENVIRATTYVSAKMRGFSPSEAAAWSLKHHFDYQDLSPFERNVGRRLFPFWTFFARNTRLQAEKLLTRPGRLATIGKVLNNAAKLAGYQSYQQYSQSLSDSQKQGLPVPIKIGGVTFNAYLSPPTTDLNQLTANPKTQFFNVMQRFTFYKTIPELLMNYSWFFRGQIQNPQAPLVPAPAPAADLPGPVKKLLGLTTYVDKRSGKRILGWPAKVDYAFRQITPDVNTALQLATPVPGSRGMSQKTQALSALTGIRLAPNDQQQQATNRIDQLYQQLNSATDQLDALNQRLGKTPDGHYPQPPESKKLRATIKTLNQKIGQLKSQRGDALSGIASQQRPKKSGSFIDSHSSSGKSFLDSGSSSTKSFLDH